MKWNGTLYDSTLWQNSLGICALAWGKGPVYQAAKAIQSKINIRIRRKYMWCCSVSNLEFNPRLNNLDQIYLQTENVFKFSLNSWSMGCIELWLLPRCAVIIYHIHITVIIYQSINIYHISLLQNLRLYCSQVGKSVLYPNISLQS